MDFLREYWLDITTTILGLAYIILEYKASIWLWLVGILMESLGIVLCYQKGLYADCGMEFYYLGMSFYGFIMWKFFEGGRKKDGGWKNYEGGSDAAEPQDGRRKNGSTSSLTTSSSLTSETLPNSTIEHRNSTIEHQPSLSATTSNIDLPNSSFKCTHFERKYILPWTIGTLAIWATIWWLLVTYTDSRVPIADSFTTALSMVGIWALARKYLEQWLIWIVVDVVTCVLYFYKDIPFKASLYGLYVIIAIAGYYKWKKQLAEN